MIMPPRWSNLIFMHWVWYESNDSKSTIYSLCTENYLNARLQEKKENLKMVYGKVQLYSDSHYSSNCLQKRNNFRVCGSLHLCAEMKNVVSQLSDKYCEIICSFLVTETK